MVETLVVCLTTLSRHVGPVAVDHDEGRLARAYGSAVVAIDLDPELTIELTAWIWPSATSSCRQRGPRTVTDFCTVAIETAPNYYPFSNAPQYANAAWPRLRRQAHSSNSCSRRQTQTQCKSRRKAKSPLRQKACSATYSAHPCELRPVRRTPTCSGSQSTLTRTPPPT